MASNLFPTPRGASHVGAPYLLASFQRVDLYVAPDAAGASDGNVGSIAQPLASLDEAMRRAKRFVVIGPDAPVVIHLASGTYSWTRQVCTIDLRAPLVFIGDGAGQDGDDGFTELATGTAAAGTGAGVLVTSGLTVDALAGKTLEITSGANEGWRRTIRDNTTTNIVPVQEFTGLAAGDTFRVLEPAVTFELPTVSFPTLASGEIPGVVGCGRGSWSVQDPLSTAGGTRSAVAFVNMTLQPESGTSFVNFSGSTLLFHGVEVANTGSFRVMEDPATTYLMGCDFQFAFGRSQVGLDLGAPDPRAWGGWGLSLFDGAQSGTGLFSGATMAGFLVVREGIVTVRGTQCCRLLGGRCEALVIQTSRASVGYLGTGGVPVLLDDNNEAGTESLGIVGGSEVEIANLLIRRRASGIGIVAGITGDGQVLTPGMVGINDVTIEVVSGTLTDGVTVTNGGQAALAESGAITITGAGSITNELAVRAGNQAGTLVDSSTVAGLSAGDAIPDPATSDGRDGFIRRNV